MKRGCLRDISSEEKSHCQKTSPICKPCVGNNCNIKNFQMCATCHSKDNIECSGNTTIKGTVCEDYAAERCFIGLDIVSQFKLFYLKFFVIDLNIPVSIKMGYTQRFCGYGPDYKKSFFPPNKLKVCHANNCNLIVYPADRLKCYRCQGEECNYIRRASNTLEPVPCGRYIPGDQCYSYLGKSKTKFTIPFL